MRQIFCRKCGAWHPDDAVPMECHNAAPIGRSDELPVPMFISDTMDATEHIDGKLYTSKSRFRSVTKAHGMIEVGNDPQRLKHRELKKPNRTEIKDSVQKAAARYRNGERA